MEESLKGLYSLLKRIEEIKNEETKIIERLPEDMNCHLWFRRWFIITKKAIQDEIDKIEKQNDKIEIQNKETKQ